MSKHYKEMEIQPYEVMRAHGVLKEYLWGATIKYLFRAGKKKDVPAIADLAKAHDSIDTLIHELEQEREAAF